MKKTIVALIVMGSVAFGASATLTPNDKPAATKVTYAAGSKFGNLELSSALETGYVNGNPRLNFSGVTLDLKTVTETNGTRKVWTDDYTVSVWLANTTSTDVLFGYAHSWSGGEKSNAIVWDATNKCIKMGVGEWSARSGEFTFDSGSSVSSSNLQDHLTTGLTNITLAVGSTTDGSMSADLWVNGVYINTLSSYDSAVSTSKSVSTAFDPYSSYNNADNRWELGSHGALVGSIALTDKKLTTASEVATLAGATLVPEPATATLSLMALCGLVARRRRR